MKIVADNAIPFLKGVLEPYARVEYLPGKTIATADVRDADALIVRTRTRCDAALLEGASVKLIATATIGFDHIDTEYCRRHGIEVATAAGCNARGVLQYVAAALVRLSRVQAWEPADKTLGIVGVGHVGSLVEAYARTWGFRVVACDPPREEREHGGFLPLEEVACQADILTFHTPLDDTTRHMAGAKLFERMKPGSILINTSRGEVVDGQALRESGLQYVLDVWEHRHCCGTHCSPPLISPVIPPRARPMQRPCPSGRSAGTSDCRSGSGIRQTSLRPVPGRSPGRSFATR